MRRYVVRALGFFGLGPAASESPPRRHRLGRRGRFVASLVVALTGLVLMVPNLAVLIGADQPPIGYGLALLGVAVSVGLVAAGYLLYRSDFSDINATRIAIWNVLGVVVLGSVMTLLLVYQRALGVDLVSTSFTVGNVLAIGAAAHVIIGFYDARRVRAEELARERQRIAVLNRVLRHNLRNEATVILGHADNLLEELDGELRQSAETIRERATVLGGLADDAGEVMAAYEAEFDPERETNVASVVEAVLDATREEHPEATFRADVAPDLTTALGPNLLESALEQLVQNGVVHADAANPTVRVSATADGDEAVVRIADDGPGIPDVEREVVTGEREITQLTHGSGLGLWVARAVVDSCDGDFAIDADDEGTTVTLRLPRPV